jgi:hypothetical protein
MRSRRSIGKHDGKVRSRVRTGHRDASTRRTVFTQNQSLRAKQHLPQNREVLGGVVQNRHPACFVLFPDGLARDEDR